MYVVIITWPDDPDRGMEPYGPHADEATALDWVAGCEEAAGHGHRLLQGATYLVAPLTLFDPWDLMADAARQGAAGQELDAEDDAGSSDGFGNVSGRYER